MTVQDLINELEREDPNSEVLVAVSNSSYPESIGDIRERTVSAFYGNDFDAVVIRGSSQVGGI